VHPLESKKNRERKWKRKGRNSSLKAADATHKNQVLLPEKMYEEMMRNGRRLLPNEACGLISGRFNKCMTFWPMVNIEPSPFSFAMDVNEQDQVEKKMKQKNQRFMGIFHTHPFGQAVPSKDDIRSSFYPDVYYFIAAISKRSEELRCYKIKNGAVLPVEIVYY
jgi:[CysO sulfur-carrier protein]-S-L-cysteine hydrolase